MKYSAKVEVRFKSGLLDPEGDATKKSLKGLRFSVDDVKISKAFHIVLEANSEDEAHKIADEMCKKLLANPNKDDYKITVEALK